MSKLKSVDYRLFFWVLTLIIFGMVMISSVSVYSSFWVTKWLAEKWLIETSYNYFYVIRNIVHVILSLFILWIITKTPYTFFQKYVKYIFYFVIFLLIFVLIKWVSLKWASWWISIPWFPLTIQPTEFLKFSFIIFLANFFKINKAYISDFNRWFLPFTAIIWLIVLLVWLQPDFWTLMVLLPVSVIMFFISGANLKYLAILFLLWIFLVLWVYNAWKYDKNIPSSRNSLSYITDRIDNFLSDNKTSIENKTINYQTKQGLIAIWSWWFSGLGFGESIQKFWYLPEVQWDFIFSVIVEELGLLWAIVLVSVFWYIWYRWFMIAAKLDDLFAKYSAIGISSWILVQAFINIWVNLNIIPLTWITLPFVSYWWSSLLALAIAIWFLLNISRYVEAQPKYSRLAKKSIFNIKAN